jgi:hypothetical protein
MLIRCYREVFYNKDRTAEDAVERKHYYLYAIIELQVIKL